MNIPKYWKLFIQIVRETSVRETSARECDCPGNVRYPSGALYALKYRLVTTPHSIHASSFVTLARPPKTSSLQTADRFFRKASCCLWHQVSDSLCQTHLSFSTSDVPYLAHVSSEEDCMKSVRLACFVVYRQSVDKLSDTANTSQICICLPCDSWRWRRFDQMWSSYGRVQRQCNSSRDSEATWWCLRRTASVWSSLLSCWLYRILHVYNINNGVIIIVNNGSHQHKLPSKMWPIDGTLCQITCYCCGGMWNIHNAAKMAKVACCS